MAGVANALLTKVRTIAEPHPGEVYSRHRVSLVLASEGPLSYAKEDREKRNYRYLSQASVLCAQTRQF